MPIFYFSKILSAETARGASPHPVCLIQVFGAPAEYVILSKPRRRKSESGNADLHPRIPLKTGNANSSCPAPQRQNRNPKSHDTKIRHN